MGMDAEWLLQFFPDDVLHVEDGAVFADLFEALSGFDGAGVAEA